MNADEISQVDAGRPLVFRHATVLTMDDAGVLDDADVLVVGDTIAAVGPHLDVPDGALEIDAAGGIVAPGMVDTHRHMWQTALRGLGADWTLTQYFVFYYLSWGKIFRPQDIAAGNLLSAAEAVDAGVTTTLDWSHGLQTIEHGEAAADSLRRSPGRFVLAYGNLLGAPWEWTNSADFRSFVARIARRRQGGSAARLRRHRRTRVPREGRVRGGARARAAGHDPCRRLGRHQRRQHPADVGERLHDPGRHLRARGHA